MAALVLLLIVLAGQLTVAYAVGCMCLFALGAGTSSPAALSKALEVDAGLVGAAAGLYGFAQMAVGALCTLLIGIGSNPALAAASVLAAAVIFGPAGFRAALGWDRKDGRR